MRQRSHAGNTYAGAHAKGTLRGRAHDGGDGGVVPRKGESVRVGLREGKTERRKGGREEWRKGSKERIEDEGVEMGVEGRPEVVMFECRRGTG